MDEQEVHDDEQEVLTRGYTDECLEKFFNSILKSYPRGSTGLRNHRIPMREFIGISDGTLLEWMYRGGNLPRGEILIKVQCFLMIVGYDLIEMSSIDETTRNFLKLIGFGVISINNAIEMLSYKKKSSLYAVLAGKESPKASKQEKMWEIWKGLRAELKIAEQNAIRKLASVYNPNHKPSDQDKPALADQPIKKGKEIESEKKDNVKHSFLQDNKRKAVVKLIEGLSLLLDEDLFANLDQKDRTYWRQFLCTPALALSSHLTSINSGLMAEGGETRDA
ncbi:hypothetical protein CL632_03090 [bacterium]|jgi:hypothetical protein|nr:hypothetical protein [bacterium]|tara:strand:+ start:312 stop:1145 length:834 start_codon:yes stop_codon:yes gene_type:complete